MKRIKSVKVDDKDKQPGEGVFTDNLNNTVVEVERNIDFTLQVVEKSVSKHLGNDELGLGEENTTIIVDSPVKNNGEPEKKKNRNRKRQRSSELIATEGKENHPMLDPCNFKFKNCALKVTEERRKELHSRFWSLSYTDRRNWLINHIVISDVKRRYSVDSN